MLLNEYYHQNPEHIIGKLEVVDMYGRKGLTCKKDCFNPFEKLNQFLLKTSAGLKENNAVGELKSQVSLLCQELAKLSEAFANTSQALLSIQQKIAAME